MNIYDKIEEYLPEMTELRANYDAYLKENNLSKTEEQKLFDYFQLVSASYEFNKEKMITEFHLPVIGDVLKKTKEMVTYGVVTPISERMRYHQMQDLAEFSSFVKNEIYEKKDRISVNPEYAWTYKRFPAHDDVTKGKKTDMVRYALNVKPGIGLFKKLDNLCLKYNAFDYKIADEKMYNWRVDPVIIYAQKSNQKEMSEELERLIKPYRRKDEYDMPGYKNSENGIYTAEEVKREQILQLKYDILTPDEKNVFTHPVEDDWEQDERENMVLQQIYNNEKEYPVKSELIFWLGQHEYDYSLSSAQYQVAKLLVNAYNKTRENDLFKAHTLNNSGKTL